MTTGDRRPARTPWMEPAAKALFAGARGGAELVRDNWRALAAVLTIGPALVFTAYIFLSGKPFWDFAVYRAGIAAFKATGTAYDPRYLLDHYGVDLPFTYPPLVLLAFDKLSWLFTSMPGLALLLAAHLAALAAILRLQLPKDWAIADKLWVCGVFLAAFGLAGTKLFLTGNVAAVFAAATLGALAWSVPRKTYWPLWAILALVCQVKIYFICFAAVPFFLHRKIVEPAVIGLAIIASTALNYFVSGELFQQFVATMRDFSHQAGFSGTSVMSGVELVLKSVRLGSENAALLIALGVHLVYALMVAAFGAAVLWSRPPRNAHVAFLFAFMGALLASPRLIEYDMALLAIPFVVFLRDLLRERGLGLGIAVAGFLAALVLVRTPLADWGGFVALLGVWLGMGIAWLTGPQGESLRATA